MKTILCLLFSALCLLSQSGCTAIVAAQLKGKLPNGAAKSYSVSINIVGAGGGSITAKDVVSQDGKLTAGEYHSQINTAGGTIKVDAEQVEISALKK